MSEWLDILGWGEQQIDELRFVGYIYLKEGQYETARHIYEGLVLLEPENPYNRQTLGAIYMLLNRYDLAITALHQALELNPDHLPSKLNLAKAYLYKGDKIQGLGDAKKLMSSANREIADDAEALVLAYNG